MPSNKLKSGKNRTNVKIPYSHLHLTELFSVTEGFLGESRRQGLDWLRDDHKTPVCIDKTNAATIRTGLDSVRGKLCDSPAAKAVVEAVETGLAKGWQAAIAKERELLVGLRHTEIARKQLEAFFAGAR